MDIPKGFVLIPVKQIRNLENMIDHIEENFHREPTSLDRSKYKEAMMEVVDTAKDQL